MAKVVTTGESKPAKTPKSKPAAAPKPNVFARLGQYFRDVRSEMKRVVWPERTEVVNSSIVVVVTLLFFVAFTLATDTVVVEAVKWLTEIGQ